MIQLLLLSFVMALAASAPAQASQEPILRVSMKRDVQHTVILEKQSGKNWLKWERDGKVLARRDISDRLFNDLKAREKKIMPSAFARKSEETPCRVFLERNAEKKRQTACLDGLEQTKADAIAQWFADARHWVGLKSEI